MLRASELGYDRIVAGMHSCLDVIGGRMTSTAIAASNLYDGNNADAKKLLFNQDRNLPEMTVQLKKKAITMLIKKIKIHIFTE